MIDDDNNYNNHMNKLKEKLSQLEASINEKENEREKYEDERRLRVKDIDKQIKKHKADRQDMIKDIDEQIINCDDEIDKLITVKKELEEKVNIKMEEFKYLEKLENNKYDKENKEGIYVLSCGLTKSYRKVDGNTNYRGTIGCYSSYKNAKLMLDHIVSQDNLSLQKPDNYNNITCDATCRDRYDFIGSEAYACEYESIDEDDEEAVENIKNIRELEKK